MKITSEWVLNKLRQIEEELAANKGSCWYGPRVEFLSVILPVVMVAEQTSAIDAIDIFDLHRLEDLAGDSSRHGLLSGPLSRPIRQYLETIPGYSTHRIGHQDKETHDQFIYRTGRLHLSAEELDALERLTPEV